MMFAHTLVWKNDHTGYEVKPTKGRMVRDRNVQSERLGLYLHPDFHDFSFSTIKDEIKEVIKGLQNQQKKSAEDSAEESQEEVNYVADKIGFLKGLMGIMDAYCAAENPRENAKKDFSQLLTCQAPPVYKHYIGKLAESCFDQEAFNKTTLLQYNLESTCFSKIMTNDNLIRFYSDDKCFSDNFNQILGKPMCLVIRSIITRFLGKDHIQSK